MRDLFTTVSIPAKRRTKGLKNRKHIQRQKMNVMSHKRQNLTQPWFTVDCGFTHDRTSTIESHHIYCGLRKPQSIKIIILCRVLW